MKGTEKWKGKKIGLVLSGGGAKGAYQVGMLRVLEELGLAGQICAIAGTSIGALDGMAYAAAGIEGVRKMLYDFGQQFTEDSRQTSAEVIQQSRDAVCRGEVSLGRFVSDPDFSEYSSEMFRAYLKELLPDQVLAACGKKVYGCAYSMEDARPEYFLMNDLDPCSQRDLLLASASLPYVFPPVAYGGKHYLDGGVVPPLCPDTALPADKIPLKAILGEEVDVILVCFLNPADTVDSSQVPAEVEYVELRPSRPLEKFPGEGTLDFAPERLESHEALGYNDTRELFFGRPGLFEKTM